MGRNSVKFETALRFGQTGESEIAHWLRRKGFAVLPVYEKILDTGKGPQLFLPNRNLIAPDMLVFRGDSSLWIEAKHKTAFSWHRITRRWVTGIDLRHYSDYLLVDDNSPWPVWLLFLHQGGQAKDSPPNSPSGLFGNKLSALRKKESHRCIDGYHPDMVYWSIDQLVHLAALTDIQSDKI